MNKSSCGFYNKFILFLLFWEWANLATTSAKMVHKIKHIIVFREKWFKIYTYKPIRKQIIFTGHYVIWQIKLSLAILVELLQDDKFCMCGSRGGGGQGVHPLENYKIIGFLSNTGLDPLKITELPSQHSMLGHHHFNDVSLADRWWPAKSGISIHPPLIKLKNKTLSKLDPLWHNFLDPRMFC